MKKKPPTATKASSQTPKTILICCFITINSFGKTSGGAPITLQIV
jgi:hypothetical protein